MREESAGGIQKFKEVKSEAQFKESLLPCSLPDINPEILRAKF